MYPYLNNKTIKEIKIFEKEKFLKFEVMFDDVKVFFDYDRAWDDNIDKSILIHKWNGQSIPPPDDARQHFIGDIRLDIQRNDSLLKMIYEILSDNVDIKINNETALWVEKIMKDIQEIIFKEYSKLEQFYGDKDIEAFIRENYPEDILTTYRMINPEYGPAKADYFRYLLMYKINGASSDSSKCGRSTIIAHVFVTCVQEQRSFDC